VRSIKDEVAIVGMGCTKFGENWDMGEVDIIVEAAYEAFEDAGIEPKDIQAAWVGTLESGWMGLTLSGPLKLQYIPVTRVENMCGTAMDAVRGATYAIASGARDIALALGFEKLKNFPGQRTPVEIVRTPVGEHFVPATRIFAMAATRYFYQYGLSPEEGKMLLAQISVKNHHNGTMHPKAHLRRDITVEQVMNAPMIVWPLGLFDCCALSDGAAAAVLCRADMAKNFRSDPVYIKSLQICAGPREGSMRTDYDFVHMEESTRCAKAAYAEAGIKDPYKELSSAEVHDCFSIHELIIYEDMGWCPRGKARELVESGATALNGELPVNTDGGLKCFGHPAGASGLRMIYELYNQLRGKADSRQVKDPRLGLAHNMGGVPGGGLASIAIVGNELGYP